MHDGIHLDRAGIPAATICTDHFVATGQATATVWGVPNYPVIYMPHPLSTCPDAEQQELARRVAGQVVQILLTASVGVEERGRGEGERGDYESVSRRMVCVVALTVGLVYSVVAQPKGEIVYALHVTIAPAW